MTQSETQIIDHVTLMRKFHSTGITRDVAWRIQQLKTLKRIILEQIEEINAALWQDLRKSEGETYLTEISMVLGEIDHHVKYLKKWAKSRRVSTPLPFFPSKSRVMYEPYGVVLVIAPWNYPFQLLLEPLVGAISAGNCAVLKPSPFAPATANIIRKMLVTAFDPRYVSVFEGDGETATRLLQERFDYIFFTGGPRFGRQVMEAASKYLTPVTLELGGKSPCFVGKEANLEIAARRIAWGKYLNAGQTCVAPDYVLVHADQEKAFITAMKKAVHRFYGENPRDSPDYTRIIHREATERLIRLMNTSGVIVMGGESDVEEKYIAPTILADIDSDSPIMQEEIFGPLLPVLTYRDLDEAIIFVNQREKPLALYYFGGEKEANKVLKHTSSGGVCVNDTILHLANPRLPFGGVGMSGIGKYHGKASFELFSNLRSVVISSTLIDNPFRYSPYKHLKLLKKFM